MPIFFELDSEFYSDQVLEYCLTRGMMPEPEVINALSHILEPGDVAVDAGANVGFFTVIMSKLVGKQDGMVFAIEPDPRNRKKLLKNIDINDCHNVIIVDQPLAARSELRDFYVQSENGSSTMFDGADPQQAGTLVEKLRVEARTLSDIIGANKPKFMKMDIEGAEYEAIRGCDVRIPFVISEINEEALKRAGSSIPQLRFHFENIWGHRTHILSETGSMPAILASSANQQIEPTRPNANVLFAREWDVVRAWPKVKV